MLLNVYFVLSLLNQGDDAANVFTGADVMPFGSFESNFYTPWGDLDLSLELPVLEDQAPAVPKSRKVKILRSIERALLKSGTSDHHISRNFLLPYCSSW